MSWLIACVRALTAERRKELAKHVAHEGETPAVVKKRLKVRPGAVFLVGAVFVVVVTAALVVVMSAMLVLLIQRDI